MVLERTPDKREVDGSSPFRPTIHFWGLSSAGRAPALHAGGQRFDPAILHHIYRGNSPKMQLIKLTLLVRKDSQMLFDNLL